MLRNRDPLSFRKLMGTSLVAAVASATRMPQIRPDPARGDLLDPHACWRAAGEAQEIWRPG
jgi:hypothetical protein